MNPSSITQSARPHKEQGQVKIIALILAVFCAGIAVSALWFYRQKPDQLKQATPAVVLSASTREVLHHMVLPVEIHFYSSLDTSSVPVSVQAFAGRVDQLLSACEGESGGKLKVAHHNSLETFDPAAAAADGVKPFNLDKGDACYLGMAVVRKDQKETFSPLAPEWEQALEFDLARAIARVTAEVKSPTPMVAATIDPAAIEAVRKTIPNVDTTSIEEGTKILREAALNEFKQVAQEMDAKVKEAQQKVMQAQTDAEKQAALQELQQAQTDQMEKIKEVAAKSKAQADALQQLKRNARR